MPAIFQVSTSPERITNNVFIGYIVGNKAKGQISKRVFQQNKARRIFRKTNIS